MRVRDPVCGMQFESAQAQATSVHDGTEYYFCSPGCKAAFEQEPERYHESGHGGHHEGHGHEGHGGGA